MATVDLVMPKMGESIMEATILKWHKQPGDAVKMDETVLEIATDKVDTEVPSTAEGTISEILFNVNDVVPVGTVIARVKTSAEVETQKEPVQPQPQATSEKPQEASTTHHDFAASEATPNPKPQTPNINGNRFYSPLVLNIAAQEGISMSELEGIPGTGNEGRVTKRDILQYVSERKQVTGGEKRVRQEQSQFVIPVNKVEQREERASVSEGSQLAAYTC
ncbi:MAG: E3 binding domain-containing protein, partial [Flavisolibacter sp.]|nr:E3 binding domain-containing protein [Flavisolibacter sp.]